MSPYSVLAEILEIFCLKYYLRYIATYIIIMNIVETGWQVTRLGEFFESYQILFVEGGSKDNTVQVFKYVSVLFMDKTLYLYVSFYIV